MPYTVQEEKEYAMPVADVFQAALGAIEGLEGKVLELDRDSHSVTAQFHKTILGKVLGDRSWMKVELTAVDANNTKLSMTAYPLNAVGQKLLFGARKGVLRTVLTWFYAHLEHRLPKAES